MNKQLLISKIKSRAIKIRNEVVMAPDNTYSEYILLEDVLQLINEAAMNDRMAIVKECAAMLPKSFPDNGHNYNHSDIIRLLRTLRQLILSRAVA